MLIPRVFYPDKPDADIPNFFSRTVGADIGVSGREGTLNGIAISMPFEFVGNYGWCAGILSFGLIGVFWSLVCGWMLSPARLSNHPLTPFLVLFVMNMEQAVGYYLADLRQLIIPMLLCYFIYRMSRAKI